MSARRYGCAGALTPIGCASALSLAATLATWGARAAATEAYAAVTPGHTMTFPADFGSHPEFRTEWWYVTGWLRTERGEDLGFQITFFRTRPDVDDGNPSAFTPRQLLMAHCAISDPKHAKFWHDQRVRRAGLGLAQARQGDTDVWLDHWALTHGGTAYNASLTAENFSLRLSLAETQPVLINGRAGVSQKGPAIESASYYYSLPHLKVSGAIRRDTQGDAVSGEAWFDHEWSSEYLDPQAAGWDWIGINFDDGGALMAFRIRDLQGKARWAGGTLRDAGGAVRVLAPDEVDFRAERNWISPRTAAQYPVQWHVRAASADFDLVPLMDDQENDTRLTTGAVYWEGAVRALNGQEEAGRGYLELTGYASPLKLR